MTPAKQTRLRIVDGLRPLGSIRGWTETEPKWLTLAQLPDGRSIEGEMWPEEWAHETAERCRDAVEALTQPTTKRGP